MKETPDNPENAIPFTNSNPTQEFEEWLPRFYSECGREVTLAYTTLNQMKNWAMVIVGAFISAIVAFTKSSSGTDLGPIINVEIMVGAVLAYVLSLRFFVRAILCYINLIRWNKLQSDIISYRLISKTEYGGSTADEQNTSLTTLNNDIIEFYHNWASPIDRKTQIISNLKLGFALILALPLFFVILGISQLWSDYLVRGFAVFALGNTLLELNEFFHSSFFDTPEKRAKRKTKKEKLSRIFPIPTLRIGYLLLWIVNIIISAVFALWPQIKAIMFNPPACG